eukprot:2755729-Pyramimonas_sp.AAC.1
MADFKTPQTLQEFTRYVPPGWKPSDDAYPFKACMQRLHLWWRLTPLDERDAGPAMAALLLDRAFTIAMSLELPRHGVIIKR